MRLEVQLTDYIVVDTARRNFYVMGLLLIFIFRNANGHTHSSGIGIIMSSYCQGCKQEGQTHSATSAHVPSGDTATLPGYLKVASVPAPSE